MASIKDETGKDIVSYTIDADVLYAVLQYLASKPYAEVHTYVAAVQSKSVANYAPETNSATSDTRTVEPDNA